MSIDNLPPTEREVAAVVAPSPVSLAVISGDLLKVAQWLESITRKSNLKVKQAPPLCGYVLAEAEGGWLYLSAFDYERRARYELGVVPAALDGTRVLVPGDGLLKLAKIAAGTKVATKREPVTFTFGPGTFTLKGFNLAKNAPPVTDYPHEGFGGYPLNHMGVFRTKEFTAAFDKVVVAAAKDDTLPILCTVKVEMDAGRATLLATDRYRLARCPLEPVVPDVDVNSDVLIRASHFSHAAKVFTADKVYLRANAHTYLLACGPATYEGVLVDGDYPKIRSLFPDRCPSSWTVNRTQLLEAVKAGALVAERNTPVRITFGEGTCVLDAGTGEELQWESDPIPFDGDMSEIKAVAFNPAYLGEGLLSVDGDRVTFGHTTAPSPAILHAEDADTLVGHAYLVMPVRLPN